MNTRIVILSFCISLAPMLVFSALAVAWFDDFNDGNYDGWKVKSVGGGAWEVNKDDELYFDGGGDSVIYAGDPNWTDYTFEADVKLLVLMDYAGGIRARIDPNTGTAYSIWVYPNAKVLKLIDFFGWSSNAPGWAEIGNPIQPKWEMPPVKEFHKLKIVLKGKRIEAYWDDKFMCAADSDKYKKGCIGINGYDQPIIWDNVNVYGPGIPGLGVAEAKSKLATTWGRIKS